MAKNKYLKLFLISVIATTVLASCSTATLPKSKDLLETEVIYEKVSNDLNVSQNAESELKKAGKTLQTAARAETKEQMAALVYVANNQINTAVQAAEAEVAKKRIREIRTLKINLQNNRKN